MTDNKGSDIGRRARLWQMLSGTLIAGYFVAATAVALGQTGNAVLPPNTNPAKGETVSQAQIDFLAKVEHLRKDQRSEEALRLCRDYLSKNPKDDLTEKVTVLQAEILLSTKRGEDAVRMLDWLVGHSPNPKSKPVGDALELVAKYYDQRLVPVAAENYRKKLLTLQPQHPGAKAYLRSTVRTAFGKRDFAGVLAVVEKFGDGEDAEVKNLYQLSQAQQHGAQPQALLALGREAAARKNIPLAQESYLAFISQYPKQNSVLDAKLELGWLYYNQGEKAKLDEAEKLWRQVAAQGAPDSDVVGEAMWHLVQLLSGPRFKWKEAEGLCREIAKRFPIGNSRNEQAMFIGAWLFWAHKEWMSAREAFASFTAAYPQAATAGPVVAYISEIHDALEKKP